jgi:hypothetical protein
MRAEARALKKPGASAKHLPKFLAKPKIFFRPQFSF